MRLFSPSRYASHAPSGENVGWYTFPVSTTWLRSSFSVRMNQRLVPSLSTPRYDKRLPSGERSNWYKPLVLLGDSVSGIGTTKRRIGGAGSVFVDLPADQVAIA